MNRTDVHRMFGGISCMAGGWILDGADPAGTLVATAACCVYVLLLVGLHALQAGYDIDDDA